MITDLTKPQCFDNFVSLEACAVMLRELRFAFWQRSRVAGRDADGAVRSHFSRNRRSETAMQEWFSQAMNAQVAVVEQRLECEFAIVPNRLEQWQATRYRPHDTFDRHLDAGLPDAKIAGERELTFLIYLSAPDEGGSTYFHTFDLEFAPAPGRLVVWLNLLDDRTPNPMMLHSGRPVIRGTKTILTTWSHQQPVTR